MDKQAKRLANKQITEAEVVEILRAAVERIGSQRAFEREHGVNNADISRVLAGKQPPTAGMLRALGLREHLVYERGEYQPRPLKNPRIKRAGK